MFLFVKLTVAEFFVASDVLSTFESPTAVLSKVCQVLSPLKYCDVVPAVIVFSFEEIYTSLYIERIRFIKITYFYTRVS